MAVFFTFLMFYYGVEPLAERAWVNYTDDIEIINQTFLGNWERNYYGDDAPDTLNILWKLNLGTNITRVGKTEIREWSGAGWTGQPLMVREGADTFLIQGTYEHKLKKIDARTGKVVWGYEYDDVLKGTGTLWKNWRETDPERRIMVLQGSRLGTENLVDSDSIFSYRAVSYLKGTELWRHNVKRSHSYSRDVDASAIVYNDTAYIGLENSYFTVFDPDPEKGTDVGAYTMPAIYDQDTLYREADAIRTNNNIVTEASPAMIGRMVYVASASGYVWGYNMDSGDLEWEFFLGADVDGSPVVTYDSCLLIAVEKQFIKGPGGILKLDPSLPPEEAVVWYFPVKTETRALWDGGIIGTVSVTDSYNDFGLAATNTIEGHLYVIQHDSITNDSLIGFDGQTRYPVPLMKHKVWVGTSISTPLFTSEHLVTCGYEGIHLFRYDADSLQKLDHHDIYVEATPFIQNGRIYVAARDGNLYCFGR